MHGDSRIRYESTRLQSFTEWWQMPLLVVACVLVLGFVGYMYRRDSVELKPGFGVLLALLRLAAFAGVLLMFLDVERRSEVKVIHNSRVRNVGRYELEHESHRRRRADSGKLLIGSGTPRRIDQVTEPLADGKFLESLRQTHDVEVVKFDSDMRRIAVDCSETRRTSPNRSPRHSGEGADGQAMPRRQSIGKKSLSRKGRKRESLRRCGKLSPMNAARRFRRSCCFPMAARTPASMSRQPSKRPRKRKIPIHAVGIGSATRPDERARERFGRPGPGVSRRSAFK